MGLLDQDADELKKSGASTDKPSSGRKVNRAGLGAFKGLSKINSLTSKYRQTNVEPDSSNPVMNAPTAGTELIHPADISDYSSVEQIRGTFEQPTIEVGTKSAQTKDDVGTMSVQHKEEVGTNSVHFSEQSVSLKTLSDSDSVLNEVGTTVLEVVIQAPDQSRYEVSTKGQLTSSSELYANLKSVQTEDKSKATKSVQISTDGFSSSISEISNRKNSAPDELSDVGTKSVQSRDELSTMSGQSQYEVGSKSVSSRSELGTVSVQKPIPSRNKVGSEVGTKLIPLNQSLVPVESIFTLPKTQYSILEFIFENCQWNGSLITTQITIKEIVERTQLIRDTVVTSIKRLRSKLFIDKDSYKDGQAGWTKYQLSEIAYKEFLDRDLMPIQRPQLSSQVSSTSSSKLVSNNLNSTNLLTPPDEFESVSFLNLPDVGITKSILLDIRKNKWTVSQFQLETHIERFSKWILMPEKFKNIQNPRAIFCSNIKSIFESGIDPLDWIKTATDLEIEKLLIERKTRIEAKKRQLDEAKSLDFEDWKIELSREECLKMVPENDFVKYGADTYDHILKDYFFNNIWQKK